MKISIVISYYKRKECLETTLKSITKSSYKDFNIIIVDDASEDNITQILMKYKNILSIKYIEILKRQKQWINPCVAFNIGIKHADGDIVILQSPECVHIGDVISYASTLQIGNYYPYSVLTVPEIITSRIINGIYNDYDDYRKIPNKYIGCEIDNYNLLISAMCGWYCHPIIRPSAFHFIAAIHRQDLNAIGGFNEEFANGIGFDDDEFLSRLKRRISYSIVNPDLCYGIHLYHNRDIIDFEKYSAGNSRLFASLQGIEGYEISKKYSNKNYKIKEII